MRVLMVLSSLEAGGAEMTALELLRGRPPGGWEVVVAAVKGGAALRERFGSAASAVYEHVARFRYDPLGLWRMARIVRREGIDAVIVVDAARDGMFYGLLGSTLSRRPMVRVCWCKSVPSGQSKPFVAHLRGYEKLGLVDAVVCASRLQRSELAGRGLPRRKMPLIRNGVDLERIARARPPARGLPKGKKLILQVANVMPDKDHATLLAAAGMLARRRDDFRLLLAGRGTDSPRMVRAAAAAGAEGVVSLLGYRDDVPALLRAADIFVLSTGSEVFSVATLEAMAAALPVVVSDIPAFAEMFDGGREGVKVPPGDAASLAEALERLLDDPALAGSLAAAGHRRGRLFSRQRMAECFRRLLAALARKRLGGH